MFGFNTRFIKIIFYLSILLFIVSCGKEETIEESSLDIELRNAIQEHSPNRSLDYFMLPESQNLSSIPQDPNNPLTPEKVALGAFLFHETALGSNPKNSHMLQTYSCASCHHAKAGFQSGNIQGIGEGGLGFGIFGEERVPDETIPHHDAQAIRTPTVLNVAFQSNVGWNGSFGSRGKNIGTQHLWQTNTIHEVNRFNMEGVETHTIAALDLHGMKIDENLLEMSSYKKLFDQVFADQEENDRYSKFNAAMAISAFQRTVVANNSPWQLYLKGDKSALSEEEKEGALLFFTKANCVSCHTGPALNSMEFYALGTKDLVDCEEPTLYTSESSTENLGRGGFTQEEEDLYKFKVPQLYNLKRLNFLGHGSSFSSIRDIIEYKNNGTPENSRVPNSQLAEEFAPLGLNSQEIDKLSYFIEHSLYDGNLTRYTPNSLPSGLCFPNADYRSKEDMGCH